MSGSGETGKGVALVVGLLVAAVVLALVVGHDPEEPYALGSSAPSGYGGLRLVLDAEGVTARTASAATVRADRSETVLVVSPALASPTTLRRYLDVARAGGRVVLAGPARSTLGARAAPGRAAVFTGQAAVAPVATTGRCDVDGLEGLGELRLTVLADLVVPADATSCYGDGRRAPLTVQRVGAGEVVTLSSPELLTNETLRAHDQNYVTAPQPDNAVVAVRLLVPEGVRRVAVVPGRPVPLATRNGRSLSDLLPVGWRLGLAQAVVAVGFLYWWKARRLGRVVSEPLPVEIAGSDLTAATGELLRRQGRADRAAAVVRAEVTSDLARRLGVVPGTGPDALAGIIASRTGRSTDAVVATLAARPVLTDGDLVEVTRDLESIRQEVLRV